MEVQINSDYIDRSLSLRPTWSTFRASSRAARATRRNCVMDQLSRGIDWGYWDVWDRVSGTGGYGVGE